jgi:hypothetical protein
VTPGEPELFQPRSSAERQPAGASDTKRVSYDARMTSITRPNARATGNRQSATAALGQRDSASDPTSHGADSRQRFNPLRDSVGRQSSERHVGSRGNPLRPSYE